jgi:hypothetical protein
MQDCDCILTGDSLRPFRAGISAAPPRAAPPHPGCRATPRAQIQMFQLKSESAPLSSSRRPPPCWPSVTDAPSLGLAHPSVSPSFALSRTHPHAPFPHRRVHTPSCLSPPHANAVCLCLWVGQSACMPVGAHGRNPPGWLPIADAHCVPLLI